MNKFGGELLSLPNRCTDFQLFVFDVFPVFLSDFPHKIIMSAWLLTNTLASTTFTAAHRSKLPSWPWTLQPGNPATHNVAASPSTTAPQKICSKSCVTFLNLDNCIPMMSFFPQPFFFRTSVCVGELTRLAGCRIADTYSSGRMGPTLIATG